MCKGTCHEEDLDFRQLQRELARDRVVRELKQRFDPECWESYSGKPRKEKQLLEVRRRAATERAERMYAEYGTDALLMYTPEGKS